MRVLIVAWLFWWSVNPAQAQSRCDWPLWESFAKTHIQPDGRVIDFSAEAISTSEGESYALFFSLVARDRAQFDRILTWTINNLAKGNLAEHLPAWKWGKAPDGNWRVLDENSASDADTWIAYSLLQAATVWHEPKYRKLGQALLRQIVRREVVELPEAGAMLLPGPVGFALPGGVWRLNPSYLPVQLLRAFAKADPRGPWNTIILNNQAMLAATTPKGVVPDWVLFRTGSGFSVDAEKGKQGSYDAIRVYLWWGMLDNHDPMVAKLRPYLSGMTEIAKNTAILPEKVAVETGLAEGRAPVGFGAALEPCRLKKSSAPAADPKMGYYNYVLSLFGLGWSGQRFRFAADGRLVLP